MLSFYAELDGAGTFWSRPWGASVGSTPGVGFSYPAILKGVSRNVFLEKRSLLDYLKTGKTQIFGDHGCSNLQVTADVAVPIQVSGPFLPYDPLYGLDASLVHAPGLYYGYDINEVIDAFEFSLVTGRKWVYRETPIGGTRCLISDRENPFSYGRTCSKSYAVMLSSTASRRYSLQGSLGVSYRLNSVDKERSIFIHHFIGYEFRYSNLGVRTYTFMTAMTTVLCAQASAPGSTTAVQLFLAPNGTWTTRNTQYTNPPILQSMTEVKLREIFANPQCLFGQTYVSPLAIEGTNPPTHVITKDSIVATYDDSPATIFKYEESLARFIFQRVYCRKKYPVPTDWTEIGDTTADNINQVNINSLAYVQDLGSICGSLRAIISLAGNPRNPKAWSSWWLSMRYGDRLTYRDTMKLSKAVSHSIAERFKGTSKDYYVSRAMDTITEYSIEDGSTLEIQRYMKLYYKPKYDDVISRVIRKSLEWDLWPTLENSWDLVPFSFVVDWFVDVQGALEFTDRQNLMLLYRVLSVIQTEKRIYTVDDTPVDDLFVTNMKIVAYDRNLLRSLPTSPFRVDRGHLASINIVDGVSLLFQTL